MFPRASPLFSGWNFGFGLEYGDSGMIRIPRAALGLAAMLAAGAAPAADEPDELMPGRIVLIRTGVLAKFVAKAPSFDLPDASNNPTVEGGSLHIFDTAGPASDTYTLPASGWKGLGNPAGSRGHKYQGLGNVGDPCRVVLVRPKVVKAVCKGAGVQMATPFSGDVGVVLDVGTDTKRYCAQFGGTQVRNDLALLKKKAAGAPGSCPSQSASTTTSTTTSSSTAATIPTTTSTINPSTPCCGGLDYVAFTNGLGVGNCGRFLSADGSQFAPFDCGGLYLGGGSNSVPLPFLSPDETTSITKITSCTGQSATLGPTTSTDVGNNIVCTDVGCLFGGPLPIPNASNTPTSACVIFTVAEPAAGTLDCALGATHIDLPLDSEVFLTGDSLPLTTGIQPCPLCTGGQPNVTDSGTCQGGADNGMACTPRNTAQTPSYPTSHQCHPLLNLSVGTVPLGFNLDSGTINWTATPAPNPNSTGQTRVFCGYCRDSVTTGFQNPAQQCWENATAVGPACTNSNPTCQQRTQGAFGPNGNAVRTITGIGTPAGSIVDGLPHGQRLVSVFCIPPTFNPTLDAAGDVPGPGGAAFSGEIELCATGSLCPEP